MTKPALTTATDLSAFQESASRLRDVSDALNGSFIEREEEIRAMMVSLVARVHLLLLGPPGTGKSAIANALSKSIENGRLFSVLLTKFSVPEEVFGPISLSGLENDDYRRVTKGYLPEAEIAFIDEIFKSNSALLNSLLTVLNERAFDNGGSRVRIPLELAIGASNELPEEGAGLEALYDRFVLRRWVDYISDDDGFEALLAMEGEPEIDAVLLPSDLATVRAFAERVDIRPILPLFSEIRRALAQEHGIVASDRRWRSCVRIVRANAALNGRLAANGSDLLVLADALWNKPEERAPIYGTIAGIVAPDLAAALALVDAAAEISEGISGDCGVQALATANTETKKILAEISKLDGVEAETEKVAAMQKAIARRVLAAVGGV
jgi:MoxR-like ATPase